MSGGCAGEHEGVTLGAGVAYSAPMRPIPILAALCATLAACSDGGSGDYPYATTGVDPACRYANTPGLTRAFYQVAGDPECGYLCALPDGGANRFCPPAEGRPRAICATRNGDVTACGGDCTVCRSGQVCRDGYCQFTAQ